MRLTEEQLLILQNALKDRLIYRETYDEVYDHLLTALENNYDDLPLIEKLDNIMRSDFGGFRGLIKVERKRRWLVGKQMLNKQFDYILKHFKLPLLPITIVLFVLMHYLVNKLNFHSEGFFMVLIMFIQVILFAVLQYFKGRYNLTGIQKSIKDIPTKIISQIPFYILFGGNFIGNTFFEDVNFSNWFYLHPMVLSSFCALYIIYDLAFLKLYFAEYKQPKKKLLID